MRVRQVYPCRVLPGKHVYTADITTILRLCIDKFDNRMVLCTHIPDTCRKGGTYQWDLIGIIKESVIESTLSVGAVTNLSGTCVIRVQYINELRHVNHIL